jgi:hypothetical protein
LSSASQPISEARNEAAVSVAPADIGLGDRGHRNGRLHARGHADAFERVLQSERVDDRGEHAHVVAMRALDALLGAGQPAEDVAAPDHQADLDAEIDDFLHVRRDAVDRFGMQPVPAGPGQHFARNLEQHALVLGGHRRAPGRRFRI